MKTSEQTKVAKIIAGSFLAGCLASGTVATIANADNMAPPMAKTQSATKSGGMMQHGCSGKKKAYQKKEGMMRHGCSAKGQKSGM